MLQERQELRTKTTYKIKHTKKSRIVQITLILILIGLIIFLFIQSSFFNCYNVLVKGNSWVDEEKILETAEVPIGTNLFHIDEKKISQKLELIPMIKEARIEKRLPNSIYIFITERTPAAVISALGKFILVDAEGFYIQDVETISTYKYLPLITGIEIPENQQYREKIENIHLASILAVSQEIWDGYEDYFTEINVANGANDIILFTYEGIGVKIGDADNLQEKMQLFIQLYEKAKAEGTIVTIEYFDISFSGLPIIKYK